jgi:hypothetical protein
MLCPQVLCHKQCMQDSFDCSHGYSHKIAGHAPALHLKVPDSGQKINNIQPHHAFCATAKNLLKSSEHEYKLMKMIKRYK